MVSTKTMLFQNELSPATLPRRKRSRRRGGTAATAAAAQPWLSSLPPFVVLLRPVILLLILVSTTAAAAVCDSRRHSTFGEDRSCSGVFSSLPNHVELQKNVEKDARRHKRTARLNTSSIRATSTTKNSNVAVVGVAPPAAWNNLQRRKRCRRKRTKRRLQSFGYRHLPSNPSFVIATATDLRGGATTNYDEEEPEQQLEKSTTSSLSASSTTTTTCGDDKEKQPSADVSKSNTISSSRKRRKKRKQQESSKEKKRKKCSSSSTTSSAVVETTTTTTCTILPDPGEEQREDDDDEDASENEEKEKIDSPCASANAPSSLNAENDSVDVVTEIKSKQEENDEDDDAMAAALAAALGIELSSSTEQEQEEGTTNVKQPKFMSKESSATTGLQNSGLSSVHFYTTPTATNDTVSVEDDDGKEASNSGGIADEGLEANVIGDSAESYVIEADTTITDLEPETSNAAASTSTAATPKTTIPNVADTIIPLTLEQMDLLREQSSQERSQGKVLHDEGDFQQASVAFETAANLLLPTLSHSTDLHQDFCTCRLHQALCLLKSEENYPLAVAACTDVVELGLTSDAVAPALRARAFHRRAKAHLELGNVTAALQDARSAAFLGDRKAVALYGKLMRSGGSGSNNNNNLSSSSSRNKNDGSIDTAASAANNQLSSFPDFRDLMGTGARSSPAVASPSFGDLASSAALFESLLNKSPNSFLGGPSSSATGGGDSGPGAFSPLSLLGMGAPGGSAGPGGLAKSVLTTLTKRIEDEQTQETLCQFLQATSGPQLMQLAGMSGFPLQSGQADKLASFCKSVTPQAIQKTIRLAKRGIYAVQLLRKTGAFLSKHRNVIIALILVTWIKSSITRPIPLSRRARQLLIQSAREQAAAAKAM